MITDSEPNISLRPIKRPRQHDIDTPFSSNVPPLNSSSFPTLTASTSITNNTIPISTPNSSTVDFDRTSSRPYVTDNFTRFFVVKSPDRPDSLNSVSPFIIQKNFCLFVQNLTAHRLSEP